ncbi:hypothetical protein HYPGJ_31749 [Hyphomicrobium sp. GJ21]|nr:hypothetical protein HYPGJ_31749 [Hyphomicrobium sp. GJ21]
MLARQNTREIVPVKLQKPRSAGAQTLRRQGFIYELSGFLGGLVSRFAPQPFDLVF